VYQGNWKDCVKEGMGMLIYADKSQYEGEFREDVPKGVGRKSFPDGSVY